MIHRTLIIATVFGCFAITGCTYNRYAGWKWDAGGAGRHVIDSVFSSFDDRSPTEQMQDDADEFFRRNK